MKNALKTVQHRYPDQVTKLEIECLSYCAQTRQLAGTKSNVSVLLLFLHFRAYAGKSCEKLLTKITVMLYDSGQEAESSLLYCRSVGQKVSSRRQVNRSS